MLSKNFFYSKPKCAHLPRIIKNSMKFEIKQSLKKIIFIVENLKKLQMWLNFHINPN